MIIVLSLHMKKLPQYVGEKWDYNKTYCASYLDYGWKTISEISNWQYVYYFETNFTFVAYYV